MKASAAGILKQDLKGKIRWFITLRWLAAAGLAVVITAARFLLNIPLPLIPLYLGNLFLILYNLVCYAINHRLQKQVDTPDWIGKAHRLANIQILLDLSLLTYLIYFSGGLQNPFVFYYIFHMIISSILLTNRSAYLQATIATVMVALLIAVEMLNLVPYQSLPFAGVAQQPGAWAAYIGRLLAFSSTLYIAVFLTTTIVNKLRQREQELEVSNQLLAEQDITKSQYVLIVSHDIQASLSAIESCLQTVLQGYTGTIGEKTQDMVLRANVRTHLLRFVRDLLDVSRMRTENDVAKERVDLVRVIDKEIELFRRQSEEKRITLNFDKKMGKAMVRANRFSMQQLFNNLLSNALRYTREGGRIDVCLGPTDSRQTIEIRIADNGIGIAADSLTHIFDDFYRAGNAKEFTANGTGLGLSIVKRIIELHDGKIHVESAVNKGTTFVFTLKTEHKCAEAEAEHHKPRLENPS